LQETFTAGGGANGLDEFVGGNVFEQIANSAGPQAIEDQLVVIESGDDDDPCGRVGGQQAARGGNAIERGHAQVHQDDVRLESVGRGQRLQAIAGLADNLQIFV